MKSLIDGDQTLICIKHKPVLGPTDYRKQASIELNLVSYNWTAKCLQLYLKQSR